jgi:hypothetical protein
LKTDSFDCQRGKPQQDRQCGQGRHSLQHSISSPSFTAFPGATPYRQRGYRKPHVPHALAGRYCPFPAGGRQISPSRQRTTNRRRVRSRLYLPDRDTQFMISFARDSAATPLYELNSPSAVVVPSCILSSTTRPSPAQIRVT